MMADFEPLQSDDEAEVLGEFGVQEKRKKDSVGKRHKTKSGQLFTRKSIEKKDKTLVIEHSKAIASSSSPVKAGHHRHIEGLVGPGDVEFSSSPPVTSESSTMAHYLSQSTGSIPQQILTQHSNRPQQSQIRLPASPQQWTLQKQHVSQGNVNSHQARQLQHTQSQDKLTLLERAKLMAEYQKTKGSSNLGSPGSLPSLSASHDAAFFTEGIDRSTAVASTAGYTNSQPVASLPRMGSPIERAASAHPPSVSPPPAHNGTNGTDLWYQSSLNAESGTQDGENWARFDSSGSFSEVNEEDKIVSSKQGTVPLHQLEDLHKIDMILDRDKVANTPPDQHSSGAAAQDFKRRPSQVSTISEGSESSSEVDESVWKITEEQRLYYLNQFKKLQPNEKGLIKVALREKLGPQARDFFLKSNLPVEVLSKIWHLSDLNKDNALNLEEFCIAMHLVVAVRHDIELPPVLPPALHPKEEVDPFDAPFTDTATQPPPKVETNVGVTDEEKPQSPQPQRWARFEHDSPETPRAGTTNDTPQSQQSTPVQVPASGKMPQTGVHALEHAPLTSQHSIDSANVPRQRHISADNILGPHTSWQAAVSGTSSQFQRDSEETPQSPVTTTALPIPAPSSSTKKLSSEIARPRASGGMVNLMDTKPGQLLPPPESKKSRKKLIMPQEAPVSPPTSPNPHQGSPVHSPAVATDFKPFPFAPSNVSSSNPSTNDEATSNNSAAKEDIVSSVTERGQEVAEGYERPKPAPRTKGEIERNNKDATVEQKEINFRRTPSMRRGDRPRSYTGGSMSSLESLESPSVTEIKDSRLPPTPPPRKQKGHKRGSSLDLNKLFGNKLKQGGDPTITSVKPLKQDLLPPRPPPPKLENKDEKKDKKDINEFQSIARPRPTPIAPTTGHRRSGSNEWAKGIAPPPKPTEGLLKDPPSVIYPKRPAPPKPARSKSLDPATLINDEKYRLSNVSNRSSKKQMRRNEVQAGIRLLREKNATISNLNSELQHELKELAEDRTSYELKLNKLKQSLE